MRKALVVIDVQNDFITGPLGNKECQGIIPNIIEKIKNTTDDIYITRDTHEENYLKTQEGKKLPIPHCIIGTNGWEIVKEVEYELYKHASRTYIIKDTFGSKDLAEDMEKYNEIELIGVCTDICVISNALIIKAFNPEAKIVVDASCCAGVSPERHRNALEAMKACQIEIINE